MNADDLRFFLAVRETGSIKGGARTLKVDHSTVSRRLASLEQELGVSLFERTPEGLRETDAARAIAPLAERMAELSRELEDRAKAAGQRTGTVRVAVSPVVADHLLIPQLTELRRRLEGEGVYLDIVADISRAKMLQREADIAIRQHPAGKEPAEPSALALKIGQAGFALYGSQAYVERRGRPEIPIRGLAGHEMVSTGAWAPGNAWNDALEPPAVYAAEVSPYLSAIAAVTAGVGLGILPCFVADADPRLVRFTEVLHTYDVWVVTSQSSANHPRVRVVKDALVEILRAAVPRLAG